MLAYTIPVATPSLTNLREHWAKRARRAKQQRIAAAALSYKALCEFGWIGQPFDRLEIVLTRCAPRGLDSDNLAAALKSIRDGIASVLKVDDGDPRIKWDYRQERGGPPSVRVWIGREVRR